MRDAGCIYLITGIMAAGKSTVAQALAERLPRSVHLRGDMFRRMIVNGQEEITADNWAAAEAQLHLRQDIAVRVARAYADQGYAVCYQDVIIGADLSRVIGLLEPEQYPLHVVVLAPAPEIALQRDGERAKTGYGDWTPEDLDRSLRSETLHVGLWLDTSRLSVDATVQAILDRQSEARVTALAIEGDT
jgi:chloramphenicol 3-O-phosphotransferase